MRQQLGAFWFPKAPVTYASYAFLADLNDTSSFGNTATLTRASGKVYVDDDNSIVTVGNDVAVFMDDGIFIEPSSTNLVTYSDAINSGFWTADNLNLTDNASTDPAGTTTATNKTETSATGTHRIRKAGGFGTGQANDYRAIQGFIKKGALDYCIITMDVNTRWCGFNLATGAINIVDSASYPWKADLRQVNNSYWWFRIEARSSTAAAGYVLHNATNYTAYPADAQYTGIAARQAHVWWGLQFEDAITPLSAPAYAYPGSLIPTAGASATRLYDLLTCPASHFANNDYSIDFVYKANGYADFDMLYSHRDSGNNDSYVQIEISNRDTNPDKIRLIKRTGGASKTVEVDLNGRTVDEIYTIKAEFSSAAGMTLTVTDSVNTQVATDATATADFTSIPANLDVGISADRSSSAKGWIKNLVVKDL